MILLYISIIFANVLIPVLIPVNYQTIHLQLDLLIVFPKASLVMYIYILFLARIYYNISR